MSYRLSDTLISPQADMDIRTRYERFMKKTGSPNFRDILRQRCRERVKARRGALFDHLRALNNDQSVRSALSQFIDHDLRDLQLSGSRGIKSDDLMEIVEDQPLSCLAACDREKWILEEYDKLITNAQVELAEQVACPMCKGGKLHVDQLNNTIGCSLCSLLLPASVPLLELERLIVEAVMSHENSCCSEPSFTTCPDKCQFNLFVFCPSCSFFYQII